MKTYLVMYWINIDEAVEGFKVTCHNLEQVDDDTIDADGARIVLSDGYDVIHSIKEISK